MKIKKVLLLGLVLLVLATMIGCGSTNDGIIEEPTGEIIVISREDGSGTRGAFVELLGIEQKNEEGVKIDHTTLWAEVTNSTAVMLQSIYGNDNAIGYISLGSMTDMVKALSIDGVLPTKETIKDGTYPVARPFNIVYDEATLDEVGVDFLSFVMSEQGQAIVEEKGYVSQGNNGAYVPSNLSGVITIGGSSSVTPVMEKLAESYKQMNQKVSIEVQQSDSTTGIQSVVEGVSDIGMSSRSIKDEELDLGLTPMTIAMDGIVVVIHKENALKNLTSQQVREIYMGVVTQWEDVY